MTTIDIHGGAPRETVAAWPRRGFLGGAVAVLAGVGTAAAPVWSPSHPIEILVSFPAGGTADALARLLSDRLMKTYNWPSVIVNRPGGGGIVLQNSLKSAKYDGCSIGFGASYELTYPISERMQIDRLREFDALCSVAGFPTCIMTRAGAGLDTVEDWRRKSASGKPIVFGVSPPFEWIGERLSRALKIEVITVPFRGSSEINTQLLGGTLDLALSGGSHVPLERAGRAKVVYAATRDRLPSHPNVPTLRELGSDLVIQARFLLFASREVPANIRATLSKVFAEVASERSMQDALRERGLIPEALTGNALARELAEELQIGATLVQFQEKPGQAGPKK